VAQVELRNGVLETSGVSLYATGMCPRPKRRESVDELIKLVQERTGIDATQARGAAETVIGFLKEKLPPPIAAQIDGFLGGGGTANPLAGLGDLGNLNKG
jgi:hypothetical protein